MIFEDSTSSLWVTKLEPSDNTYWTYLHESRLEVIFDKSDRKKEEKIKKQVVYTVDYRKDPK